MTETETGSSLKENTGNSISEDPNLNYEEGEQQRTKSLQYATVITKSTKRKRMDIESEATSSKMSKTHAYNVKVKNRFSALNDAKGEEVDESEDSEMENEDDPKQNRAQNEGKNRKPLPLVLHGKVNDHMAFVQLIKQSVKSQFYIKYHEDNVEVFLHCKKDYEALGTVWKSKNIKFHTYASK